MLLFNKIFIIIKTALTIVLLSIFISACSFTPIHSEKSLTNNNIYLSYAKANSRLEQIIYSDLKFKFGEKTNASLLSISIKKSARGVARSSNGTPSTTNEAILIAKISITEFDNPSNIIFSASRKATASYSANGQILADKKSYEEANERAAKQLAQVIYLTLVGALSNANN